MSEDRNLRAYIDRQMRGESAPLEGPIVDDGADRYRAALLAEQRADVDGQDGEELEDEPKLALSDFTLGASLAMGFGQATDEEIAEARPLEGEDEEPAEEVGDGLPPRVDAWWASLDPVAQERVREGTAEQAEAAHALWLARNPVSDPAERESTFDVGERMPQTGAQFVSWVEAHADEIQAEFDMTPEQYVAAMARATAAEWRKVANASGIPFEAKPSYSHIGARGQTELLRADLEESFERMREQGRHL